MQMSEREKMLAGLAHLPEDRELSQQRIKMKDMLFEFNIQTKPSDIARKVELLRQILGKAGKDPFINPPFACDYGCNIEVGDNFFANYNCVMLDNGGIKIGNNVMFAPNVSLYTVGHPLDAALRNEYWEQAAPITIGDNVWVGGNVVILPGVTIGDNAVIGAGAIVTKDIPPNTLAMGSPCKAVRSITQQDRDQYIRRYMQNA